MTIQELREKAGFSRAAFSREFDIPVRTIENWETGKRKCPSYTEKLIKEKLLQMINSKS